LEQISQYTTLKKLGSGGFGEVWLGENAIRQVAIKVFKPKEENLASFIGESGSDSQALPILRERFLNEAKILADLEANPHIISVYEFGELDDGSPYYVMPYLPKSLADLLGKDIYDAAATAELDEKDRPRALPLSVALRYIEQLLIGLSAAHERGLIHRDIKPSNVMLTDDDQIRLVDFGIAKAPDSQHSVSQVGMGSQKYMAPEQRESAKHVDASADVYSVGVMAYRMITGRLPGMPFQEPNVLVPELNQTLNDAIVGCLADDKSQREVDASTLLARFMTAKQGQSEEDYSGTWVGESGAAQIRDELLPIKEEIEQLLDNECEVTETARRGLLMMAAVVDLDENGLDDLIEQIEINQGQGLKLKRNFLKVVETTIQRNGQLSDQDRDSLHKSALPLNLAKSDVMKLIGLIEARVIGQRQEFDSLVDQALHKHSPLSEADKDMLYRAGESFQLAKSELMSLIADAEQRFLDTRGAEHHTQQATSEEPKPQKQADIEPAAAAKTKKTTKSADEHLRDEIESRLLDLHVLEKSDRKELAQIAKDHSVNINVSSLIEEMTRSMSDEWQAQHEFLKDLDVKITVGGKPGVDEVLELEERAVDLGLTRVRLNEFISRILAINEVGKGQLKTGKSASKPENNRKAIKKKPSRVGAIFSWSFALVCIVGVPYFVIIDWDPTKEKAALTPATSLQQKKVLAKAVQVELLRLGYPIGIADGIAGRKTSKAIVEFQREKNLAADGRITSALLNELKSATKRATPSPKPTAEAKKQEISVNDPKMKNAEGTVSAAQATERKLSDQQKETEAEQLRLAKIKQENEQRESAAWMEAKSQDSIAGYENYLGLAFAHTDRLFFAKNRIQELEAVSVAAEAERRRPGREFKDCSECPAMIVIPAGTFRMGDLAGVGDADERPIHEVKVPLFAMGRFEVTVEQFGVFTKATGYRTDAEKTGSCLTGVSRRKPFFGQTAGVNWRNATFSGIDRKPFTIRQAQNHPVTCMSFNDAKAYVNWLSEKTGISYRLPTESEWEYSSRAGTTTKWWWGNDESQQCTAANGSDSTKFPNGRFWEGQKRICSDNHVFTSPVGSFRANAFGLFDTGGNVLEWVQDCGFVSYRGAPLDGSVWDSNKCGVRVLRGGSWPNGEEHLRSAARIMGAASSASTFQGFRVSRDL
jgi:formylglycine-generating enzyme required for sulfatase activity/serine/threonine protein kinase